MVTKTKICNVIHGLKPTLIMLVVQIIMVGVNVFYKLAANDGMSLKIVIAYRFLFAIAFIVPIALYVERKSRPKLTWMIVFQSFLCGLFGGSLVQNLYIESLALTSATFTSAMTNLVPAITFVMAIAFRLERLNFGTMVGKAKVVGTLVGVGGAMLLTFYKGVEINLWSTKINLLQHNGHVAASHVGSGNRVLGALLALASCFSFTFWLIIQAKMGETYPCHYSSTALMTVMGSIQSIGYALCMERDWSKWKLGWNIRLLSVAYTGIVASGVMLTLVSWCVRMRGPLFVSIFNPLMLVMVAIAGSLLLEEKLYLGSVLGAVLIIVGLYMVLWGKGKEMKKISQLMPSQSFRESEQINVLITSGSSTEKSNSNNKMGVVHNSLPTPNI